MVRRRLLAAVLALGSILALGARPAASAEIRGSVMPQLSGLQAAPGDGTVLEEISVDAKTGEVRRAPKGTPRPGAKSAAGLSEEIVYQNDTLPGMFWGHATTQPVRHGDIIQTTRPGVLSSVKFYATHIGPGTLHSARYVIRFYDPLNWPAFPTGYPSQFLFEISTPVVTLDLPNFGISAITLVNVSMPLTQRDYLVTVERLDPVPAQTLSYARMSVVDTQPSVGASDYLEFVDEPGYLGAINAAGVGNLWLSLGMMCHPESQVAPTTLNVSVPLGGSGGDGFSLFNTGCTPLTYSVSAPALMTAAPFGGTVAAGAQQAVTVTVTPGIVPLGFAGFGDIQVTTNDPVTPTRNVRVNYTVTGSLRRATPGVCYATQGTSAVGTPRLYRVDLVTGAATAVGPTSGVFVPAMAIEPREGRMFAGVPSLLTRVDVGSGALALVASAPCASAMAFTPTGQLVRMGCDSTLYIVDPNTGAQVSAGPVSPQMSGIAFDPTSGLLYGVRANAGPGTDGLYRIAFPGGATTLVGALGTGLPIGDITFDEAGNLYGVVGENTAPNQLVSIDKTTGLATAIGPTGVQGLSTLAYHAPTPNCRFASRVEGFSSQYGPTDYSAQQALGPPNVYPNYGGTQFWMGSLPDAPSEYLQLGFSNPAPINFVTVYETYAPGAIRSVRVKNPDTGQFETVWTGTPAAAPPASRVFTATFPVTAFPVSEVYLDVASDLVPDFNAIDAVGIGYRDFRAGNQWASNVVDFSSQYSPTDWSAQQALGSPNIFPLYADAGSAWASATPDGQREYLELAYATASPINFVNVVETFSPGALDKVLVKNPGTGLFEQVWSGTAAPAPAVARMNTVSFPLTLFPVSQVRLEFDSPAVSNWNEIDAVGIGVCDCTASLLDSPTPSPAPVASGIEWARPNPFGVSASIGFSLARAGRVEVEVFDLLGKRVTRLADGTRPAGRHEIRWDGRDANGRTVPNGVYYLRMKADGLIDSRKIVKLR